jgi:hypothetical protein
MDMYMLKKTIIFVILVSLVSLSAFISNGYCDDDWVYVVSSKNLTKYYNSSSVKIDKQQNTIEVLIKNVYTETGKNKLLGEFDSIKRQKYIDINHDTALTILNYKDWKFTTTHLSFYSKSGKKLIEGISNLRNKDIIPNSLDDILFNKLLKDFNIQRSFYSQDKPSEEVIKDFIISKEFQDRSNLSNIKWDKFKITKEIFSKNKGTGGENMSYCIEVDFKISFVYRFGYKSMYDTWAKNGIKLQFIKTGSKWDGYYDWDSVS